MESLFRTDEVPARDRFEFWYRMVRESVLPAIVHADREGDFLASARLLELGPIRVHTMTVPPVRARRPWRLIRQSDPEQCHLVLVLRGAYGLTQADRSAVLEAGDMAFFTSSSPLDGWSRDDALGPSRQVQVQVPRALLPAPALVDGLAGQRLARRAGLRALLAGYLRELAGAGASLRPADAGGVAAATVDLVAALLAHEREDEGRLPGEVRRRALLVRVRGFIRDHLADPDLSPGGIAAAHHISTRYLHKLFQEEGTTVAAWVRAQRLAGCHRDLLDPVLRGRSIGAIAARWGFTDKSHFSRSFREAYGISASEYRQ